MAITGKSESQKGRIRLGMVGGGRDAFIGGVHRIASRIDDRFELVAGAFSATEEKSKVSAVDLGVAEDRAYGDYVEMAKREARLKNGIEAVAIVTPNHLHYPIAREFLKRGIHVICDKPLTSTLPDARKLVKAAESADALFILTHNYTGYPMARQAREMVADGVLGEIRLVQAEYPQDWLTEDEQNKQAQWRTDPDQAGAGCIGDLGVHAYNLACFISGEELDELSADLHSFVDGRRVDDNCHVLLRWKSGAKGMLWSSQVAPGNENALKVRIYGTKGGIEFAQENPNQLWYTPFGAPKQLITRGGHGSGGAAGRMTRIPPGHPEGYLEGFANIYNEAAEAIVARRNDRAVPTDVLFPTVHDGLDGVAFIDACMRSSKRNAAWVKPA